MRKNLNISYLIFWILFGTFPLCIFAQFPIDVPSYEWARAGNGWGNDQVTGSAVDSQGNLYLIGDYQSSFVLGDKYLLQNSNAYTDPFIAKVTPDGETEWLETLKPLGNAELGFLSIVVDGDDQIWLTAYQNFGSSILPNGDTLSIAPTVFTNLVLKFNTDGSLLWHKKIHHPWTFQFFSDVILDSDSSPTLQISIGDSLFWGDSILYPPNNLSFGTLLLSLSPEGEIKQCQIFPGGAESFFGPHDLHFFLSRSTQTVFGPDTLRLTAGNYAFGLLNNDGSLNWYKQISGEFGLRDIRYNSNGLVILSLLNYSSILVDSISFENRQEDTGEGIILAFDIEGNFRWKFTLAPTTRYELGDMLTTRDDQGRTLFLGMVDGSFIANEDTIAFSCSDDFSQNDQSIIGAISKEGKVLWIKPGHTPQFCTISYPSGLEINNEGQIYHIGYLDYNVTQLDDYPVVNSHPGYNDIYLGKLKAPKYPDPNWPESGFTVFPNPGNGLFTIGSQLDRYQTVKLNIYNSLGQFIRQQVWWEISPNGLEVDIRDLQAGVYFFRVEGEDFSHTCKVLKVK